MRSGQAFLHGQSENKNRLGTAEKYNTLDLENNKTIEDHGPSDLTSNKDDVHSIYRVSHHS